MPTFTNNFGKIILDNHQLELIIQKSPKYEEAYTYILYLEALYKTIEYNFIIIADLSNISVVNMPSHIYTNVINIFVNNYKISEQYLERIIVVTSNATIRKLLNGIFACYSTPHPISIVKKKDIICKIMMDNITIK